MTHTNWRPCTADGVKIVWKSPSEQPNRRRDLRHSANAYVVFDHQQFSTVKRMDRQLWHIKIHPAYKARTPHGLDRSQHGTILTNTEYIQVHQASRDITNEKTVAEIARTTLPVFFVVGK